MNAGPTLVDGARDETRVDEERDDEDGDDEGDGDADAGAGARSDARDDDEDAGGGRGRGHGGRAARPRARGVRHLGGYHDARTRGGGHAGETGSRFRRTELRRARGCVRVDPIG